MKTRKKLIEVALPLDDINTASVREGYIYKGNPSALHKWWAQRPMAAARAVIFAQFIDDPSERFEEFPTTADQDNERRRLFALISRLVKWESNNDEVLLDEIRSEMRSQWQRTCIDNYDDPNASELFNPERIPPFLDPFAGGGTLPVEAKRLGLDSFASDLNPIAVVNNFAQLVVPERFSGQVSVGVPPSGQTSLESSSFQHLEGLAADVIHYGGRLSAKAKDRLGDAYPSIQVTEEVAAGRPDLKHLVGKSLEPLAWIWARTVKSPNPAFSNCDVPLVTNFMISSRPGSECYVVPLVSGSNYAFTVRTNPQPEDVETIKKGTKTGKATFQCILSGSPITSAHIRSEALAGRLGFRMMAIVADTQNGRVVLPPSPAAERAASCVLPTWRPEVEFFKDALGFRVGNYGMTQWSDLFTDRQLASLEVLTELVLETRAEIENDAKDAGLTDDDEPLWSGGRGARAYADAVSLFLGFAVDKYAMYGNALVPWFPKENRVSMLFTQQVLSMVWDFAEVNPFSQVGGSINRSVEIVASALQGLPTNATASHVKQQDATRISELPPVVISTDPPYYDNVGYADLSDFFYIWLRRSMKTVFPELFATVAVPKMEELVTTPGRHGGKAAADAFFLNGMSEAMNRIADASHPAFPVTIYYAFKQSETGKDGEVARTGWETFLSAVVASGLAVTGTWPMRTERSGRARDTGSNALATSIVLVCRPKSASAPIGSRRDFVTALASELPKAVQHLQSENIAPVDLAQAAIGPGMAIFTRYAKVLDSSGKDLSVRDSLSIINQVLSESLTEQESEFDADTRWAIAWFEDSGFDEGDFWRAEQLSKAKNTSVRGLVDAGVIFSAAGKVRLLRPEELQKDWKPGSDRRLTTWESVHQIARVLGLKGELAAAELLSQLGPRAAIAKDLAYRLYSISEARNRSTDALTYNGLVQAWPEISRAASQLIANRPEQADLF